MQLHPLNITKALSKPLTEGAGNPIRDSNPFGAVPLSALTSAGSLAAGGAAPAGSLAAGGPGDISTGKPMQQNKPLQMGAWVVVGSNACRCHDVLALQTPLCQLTLQQGMCSRLVHDVVMLLWCPLLASSQQAESQVQTIKSKALCAARTVP